MPLINGESQNQFVQVANYSALPAPNTVPGKTYAVLNEQGTWWLPGSAGGTYYNKGLYYSSGTDWIYTNNPFNATQATVDAGLNDNQFITPLTLQNSAQLSDIKERIDELQSTSVISGTITINADTTKFDCNVVGQIRNPTTGVITTVTKADTAVSFTYFPTTKVTYVGIKADGTYTFQATRLTTEQRYSHIGEWGLVYTGDGINLIAVNPYVTTQFNIAQQYQSTLANRGAKSLNGGAQFFNSPITDLALRITAGKIEGLGWGGGDVDNPNEKDVSASVADITGQNRYSGGVYTASTSLIDPTIYESPIGTPGTAVPLPIDVTVYRITIFQSGLTRWQMGQTVYSNINEAVTRTLANADPYTVEQNIADAGCTTTFLAIQKNCTLWSQTDRYLFFSNPQTTGSSGSSSVPNAQLVYDVSSPTAEIVTNSTQGAFTIKGGTGIDTDNNFEGKNNAGTVTFSVDGNGLITGTSLKASGLTSTRVVFATTGGLLTDDANLTFGSGNLTVGTSVTTPLLIGGSAVGSQLIHKSTTANGTLTVAGHVFTGGNNGATTIMSLYNSGNVNIGNATTTNQRLVRIGQGAHFIDLGNATNDGSAAIFLDQTTPSTSNYAIAGEQTTGSLYLNATNIVRIRINGVATDMLNISHPQIALTVQTQTSGSTTPFIFTTPASTGQTVGAETIGFNLNMSATITHASNTNITTNRDMFVRGRTHAFALATGTITDAYTSYFEKPIAGTNAAITNAWAAGFAGNISMLDTFGIAFGTTTGGKIGLTSSQKLALWGATAIVQPTTAISGATLVSNAGTALTSTDTFDGYTLQQVVKALRDMGALA